MIQLVMEKENPNYLHTGLTKEIISCAYYVLNYLGSGFLESVYEKSMELRLKQLGHFVKRQEPVKVYFEESLVGDFRADLIVNDLVIVELKAVEELHPIHEVQLVNYLKATEIEVGLLINFSEKLTVKRRVYSNSRKIKEGRIPDEPAQP